ncbi:MAG: glycosyltransferase family 4 protein [Pseudoclavibacter sp.]
MNDSISVLGLFDHEGLPSLTAGSLPEANLRGPYCAELFAKYVNLDTVRMPTSRAHLKIKNVVEHRTGVPADLAIRGLASARRADAVLAILEDKSVLPAALKRRRLSAYAKTHLAVVSCWWAEEIKTGSSARRQEIARTLQSVDRIFVYSQNQAELFAQVGARDKVTPINFGVEHTKYLPDASVEQRYQVFSGGLDAGRDFETLIEAARLLPHIDFHLVSHADRFENIDVPDNVTTSGPTDGVTHKNNLLSAQLVVIPTHDLAYPTGQSVLLEAMSSGKACIVTETEAMREYIDEGVSNFGMPLHDPAGVAAIIDQVLARPEELGRVGQNARAAVEDRYTFDQMWESIAGQLEQDVA